MDVRVVRAVRAGKETRRGRPFFASNRVVVNGVGVGEVYGAEGVGSFNELYQLVVASLQPLIPVGARQSGTESEGGTGRVEV